MPTERRALLEALFLEDLGHWIRVNPRTAARLIALMAETLRDPFVGRGKPEPLRHLGPNLWSRRLTDADRILYRVFDDRIEFIQARFHYGRSG